MDPYHIMECRGRFGGSLWIGIGGLRWILRVFAKVRTTMSPLEGFFEFFRDGYRVIEFSCLSNRSGRFMEVTEYHSGAHRGSIHIPEGRCGAGWSLFEFQVHKFFLGEIVVPAQFPVSQQPIVEVRRPAVGLMEDSNGAKRHFWNSQKSRKIKENERYVPNIPITDTNRELGKSKSRSFIHMAKTEPRPTRSFHFEWRPKSKTLRINLKNGTWKEVEWVGLKPKQLLEPSKILNRPLSHNLSSEAQKDVFGLQVMLDKLSGPKASLNQYCVGEPSGTKGGSTGQITCDPDVEEDDSVSTSSDEIQDLDTNEVGVKISSEACGETGDHKPTRVSSEISPREAMATLTSNTSANSESARLIADDLCGCEASEDREKGYDMGLLPLV